jgi:hypothetical protein
LKSVCTPEDQRPAKCDDGQVPAERSLADRILAERMLRALKSGADFRRRKVRRVRGAIRAFAYENPLKLHVALDRLTEDLPPAQDPDPR